MNWITSERGCRLWLAENSAGEPQEIEKVSPQTRAWFARIDGRDSFVKWYPRELQETWGKIETAISGGNLHPAIIPLRQRVEGNDGILLIYDRMPGENLGPQAARTRFHGLPLPERITMLLAVSEALAAIAAAGFMVVDWYEGNMLYDFDAHQVWLFDWELCRAGGSFVLEMDSNYGSSRLMAPEEFVRGSTLDQITLVFNLGRYALITLPELADPLAPILARATYPARSGRYATVAEYVAALSRGLAALR